jgi:integrase
MCEGRNPDRWMFPGNGGDPLHQNSAGYLWRKTRDKAGVSYRLHDLRHFYASGLIAAGCDVVTVQQGHGTRRSQLHPEHVFAPMAEGRRPDPFRCGPDAHRSTYCGPGADRCAVNAW